MNSALDALSSARWSDLVDLPVADFVDRHGELIGRAVVDPMAIAWGVIAFPGRPEAFSIVSISEPGTGTTTITVAVIEPEAW